MKRRGTFVAGALALAVALTGCGYHALRHGGEGTERYDVVLARSFVTNSLVTSEALVGLRRGLSRAGALGEAGYPRVELEVLRVDESPEGVVGSGGRPIARGLRLAVMGRAWIKASATAQPASDTGDMKASVVIAADGPLVDAALAHDEAMRAAAARLGERLAARLSGDPVASEDDASL